MTQLWCTPLKLDSRIRYDSGPPNRRQHEQETTRRSIPGREVADHPGRHQERERLGDVPASQALLRICSIAGRMKRSKERRQRLGGEALRRPCRFIKELQAT